MWVALVRRRCCRHAAATGQTGESRGGTQPSFEEYELTAAQADGFKAKPAGHVWEYDPFKPWADGQVGTNLPALRSFSNKAVCVDPVGKSPYLTEDANGGRVYRFVCDSTDWPAGAARPAMQKSKLQL